MKRPSVVFIASIGRSGSTLLELLLHSQPGIWSMGEVYALPWEAKGAKPCGCGASLADCPFWSPLLARHREFRSTDSPVAKFRDFECGGRFLRPLHLSDILFRSSRFAGEEGLEAFCEENEKLFSAVSVEAAKHDDSVSVLVDASKDFYRLHWLAHCPSSDLRIVHIVRDPRAYVYSTLKGVGESGLAKFARCVRMAIKYAAENVLIEHVAGRLGARRVRLVRYEDLATRPEATVEGICRWLGIGFSEESLWRFREKTNHAVAGNIARHGSSGIAIDDRWESDLPETFKRIIGRIAFPAARRYGYYGQS